MVVETKEFDSVEEIEETLDSGISEIKSKLGKYQKL
jgi:hypothetical protein